MIQGVFFIMGAKERREREKEQRKNQILDTARALLLEKGLNATSINQIAKRSELSVGAIYFYYKSKEELYVALQEEGLDILYEKTREAADQGKHPADKIRGIAGAYLTFSTENKNYFDIINYFLSSSDIFFSPNLKNQVDQHGNRILSLLVKAIEDGIKDGTFKMIHAERYAMILWGTLHGLTQFKKFQRTILSQDDFEALYDEAVNHFIESLGAKNGSASA